MALRCFAASVLCLPILLATPVMAAHKPGSMSLSANGGYMWFSGKQHLKNTGLYGAAIGYDFTSTLSAQLQGSYFYTHKTRGGGKTAGSIWTVNGIYHLLPGRKFEPFLLAGIGATKINHPSNNDPTMLAHGSAGVGGELFLGDDASVSISGRDNYTFDGGKNDLWVNAGLNFYLFGK
jgi:OmpA-OmpF porin, OOP family